MAAALGDREHFQKNIALIVESRERFTTDAIKLGYRIIPSQANFVFIQPPQKGRGTKFYQALFDRNILTRYYDEEGLRDGVRMTIGTGEEMATVLQVLKEILPQI